MLSGGEYSVPLYADNVRGANPERMLNPGWEWMCSRWYFPNLRAM